MRTDQEGQTKRDREEGQRRGTEKRDREEGQSDDIGEKRRGKSETTPSTHLHPLGKHDTGQDLPAHILSDTLTDPPWILDPIRICIGIKKVR